MDNNFHIICSTDDNYAQHCGVLIESIFGNDSTNNIIIHIVESTLNEQNKTRLRVIADKYNKEIIFHHFETDIVERFIKGKGAASSIVTYYRIFITSIIKDETIDRVLYLDCDIVVNSSLEELFNLNFEKWPIAAVRDVLYPMNDLHRHNIGLGYQDKYFNAGVILINLKMWRLNNYEKELIDYCLQDKLGFFADQDALNAIFRDNWLELAPYWNRFNLNKYSNIYFKTKHDLLTYIYNPHIIHYASPTARPWMNLKFVPFSYIYNKYLAKTPWQGTRKINVEKTGRYKAIINVKLSNLLYRSPLLIRIILTSIFDIMLVVFHLLKHISLRYYSPYKI